MDLDKLWHYSEMAGEVFGLFLEQELTIPAFSRKSTAIDRKEMITWMMQIADGLYYRTEKYSLDQTTVHLAVYLFDYYIDTQKNAFDKNVIVAAAAALILAAKFEEESNSALMSIRAIVSTFRHTSSSEIWKMEKEILESVKWRLLVPTAMSFVPYLIAITDAKFVSPQSREHGYSVGASVIDQQRRSTRSTGQPQVKKTYSYVPQLYAQSCQRRKPRLWTCEYFEDLVECFCGLSLRGVAYRDFKPSEIASSAVASARFCINAAPTWPNFIQSQTKYSLSHLNRCIHLMLRDFDYERRYAIIFPQLRHRGDFATSWIVTRLQNQSTDTSTCNGINQSAESSTPTHASTANVMPSPAMPSSSSITSMDRRIVRIANYQELPSASVLVPAYLYYVNLPTGELASYVFPITAFSNGYMVCPNGESSMPISSNSDHGDVVVKKAKKDSNN